MGDFADTLALLELLGFPGTKCERELSPRSRTRDGAPRGRNGGFVSRLVDEVFVLLGMTPPGGAEYAGGTDWGDGGEVRICFE